MTKEFALPFLLLAAAVLSGCVGSEGEDADVSPTASAGPGGFDEDTGAINGIVTDAELTPLADADVQLLDTDYVTKSAQDGTFSLSNVAPGEYTLAAAKLGYEAAAQRIQVDAGAAREVKLQLAAIAATDPRVQLYEFRGFITCSIGAATVISEECGQGLQTPVGTFGRDPNNNIDWKFTVANASDVEEFQTMHLEMDWRPGSAAAGQLGFHVAHGFTCTPSCDETLGYCDVFENHGPPVQKCTIDEETLGIKNPEKDLPWDITARAWAAPVEPTEVPNIVLQQAVQMYRTEFYGEPMPEGYSAIPDA